MFLWYVWEGVERNSIQCVDCSKWIHKRCSGYKGVLREGLQYQCPRCSGKILNSVAPDETIEINLGDDEIEYVQKFCYLDDMLGAKGGVEAAMRNRVRGVNVNVLGVNFMNWCSF